MSSKSNSLLTIAILVGGIVIAGLLVISRPEPEAHPHIEIAPHIAEVLTVELGSHAIEVSSQGTVAARTRIDVTAQVAGEIVDVHRYFAAGGYFDAGEVLLRLDPRDYEIAVIKAEANLAESRKLFAQEEGHARQAKREWRDLGSQSANDLFLRVPQLAAAKASVRAAEAGLQQAKLDLERSKISLPFAGRVLEAKANLGQYVNRGAVLGTVYATDIMEVRLPLTAAELKLLNLHSLSGLHELSPLQVDLKYRVDSEELHWPGRIARLEASVDEKSRLFFLVAEIESSFTVVNIDSGAESTGATSVLPGTYVEATITSNPHDAVVVLPRNALYQRNKVLVLDGENRLREQSVEVLQMDAQKLIVRGLANGQQVLAGPPSYLDLGAVYTATVFSDAGSVQ